MGIQKSSVSNYSFDTCFNLLYKCVVWAEISSECMGIKYHFSFILKIVRFFIVKKYSHYC